MYYWMCHCGVLATKVKYSETTFNILKKVCHFKLSFSHTLSS